MEFVIENQKIGGAINLLSSLSLKGKQSRHRTKMIKDLMVGYNDFQEQLKELRKEHCNLDEDGEPLTIVKEDGSEHYDVKDSEAFSKDQVELFEESFVLEGGNVTGYLATMKPVLLDCEMEWSGQDAEIYDLLCDEFEKEENDSKGA